MFCVLTLAVSGCRGRSSQEQAEAGLEALAAGRHAQAVKHLSHAVRRQPESAALHYNLGAAYWRLGQADRALEAFSIAVDLDPADPDAWLFKGHLLLQAQRWEAARLAFGQAVHHGGGGPHALTAIARAEVGLGNPELAREYLEEALNRDADFLPARYNLASLYRDALRNPDRAYELFDDFYRQSDDPVYRQKAHAAMVRLRTALSDAETRDADPSGPAETEAGSPAQPLLERAVQLMQTGNALDQTIALLRQAVATDPQHADALWTLVELYAEQGMGPRAKEAFQRFRQRFPADPRAQRMPDLTAVETDPSGPDVAAEPVPRDLLRLADASFASGHWAQAVRQYRQALAQTSGNAAVWHRFGRALQETGDRAEALRAFQRVQELDPDHIQARYLQAVLHREQGNPEAAAQAVDQVLRRDPHHAQSYLLMAYLRFEAGNYRAARGHLTRFIELAPAGEPRRQAEDWLQRMPHR